MARPLNIFNKITAHKLNDAIQSYCNGETLQKIAIKLGISHQSLRQSFIRRNVKIRKRPSWKGSENPKWNNGGSYQNKNGYIICYKNGKKIKEHRKAMEEYLGRKLLKNEIVHHINEIKNDNRIENLEIKNPKNHNAEHAKQRWENKEWKKKILKRWHDNGNRGWFKKNNK